MRFLIKGGVLLLLALIAPACSYTAREAWDDVLKKCADTDIIGDDVLYFGPSNAIGLGSIWRESTDGGYTLRWLLSDAVTDPNEMNKLVIKGVNASCEGVSSTTWKADAGVLLNTDASPINADLKATLQKAKTVTVKVNGWAIDQIKEGELETVINSLPPTSGYKNDVAQQGRLIVLKVVRVDGMTSEFEFSTEVGAAAAAKLSAATVKIGDLGLNLNVAWTSKTTLKLSTADTFFIVGEFGRLMTSPATRTLAVVPRRVSIGKGLSSAVKVSNPEAKISSERKP
jgi:hypothetical protein